MYEILVSLCQIVPYTETDNVHLGSRFLVCQLTMAKQLYSTVGTRPVCVCVPVCMWQCVSREIYSPKVNWVIYFCAS
jgi:hypothetical protein